MFLPQNRTASTGIASADHDFTQMQAVVRERDASSPPVVLPNPDNRDSDLLRVLPVVKVERVGRYPGPEQTRTPLAGHSKALKILQDIPRWHAPRFHGPYPWRPNRRYLLLQTQPKDLVIDLSCERGCLSNVDDGITAASNTA